MAKKNGYDFWRETLNSAKLVVAPMVDQSELPWRLLSRRYGAQLCYTPMFHASVFIRDPNYRKEALVSCPEDRPLLVQFCANDAETLLKAAKYTEDFCDGIDLNLGCPQAIARRGHYGAFLEDEWELLKNIIGLCASELKIPITAKIRIFDDVDKTVQYAKMLEAAGIQLLTVHGRTKEKKGRLTGIACWEHIKAVKENVSIPVFANGNIQYLPDIQRCIQETGVDGVMTAEGNLHNPGLFQGGDYKVWDMANEYIELVQRYPCPLSYTRGHIFKMFHHAIQIHKNVRDGLAVSKCLAHIKDCVDLLEECAKEDVEAYERDPASYKTDLPRPYWICQPYVRPPVSQIKHTHHQNGAFWQLLVEEESNDPTRQKARDRDQELENLKRSMSIDNTAEEEMSRNKLKRLKRHHHRAVAKANANPTRDKYAKCGCGNPKGQKCEFDKCKVCCRDKAFRETLDCPGHKLFVKSRIDWKSKPKVPKNTSNTDAENNSDSTDQQSDRSEQVDQVLDTADDKVTSADMLKGNDEQATIICNGNMINNDVASDSLKQFNGCESDTKTVDNNSCNIVYNIDSCASNTETSDNIGKCMGSSINTVADINSSIVVDKKGDINIECSMK